MRVLRFEWEGSADELASAIAASVDPPWLLDQLAGQNAKLFVGRVTGRDVSLKFRGRFPNYSALQPVFRGVIETVDGKAVLRGRFTLTTWTWVLFAILAMMGFIFIRLDLWIANRDHLRLNGVWLRYGTIAVLGLAVLWLQRWMGLPEREQIVAHLEDVITTLRSRKLGAQP